MSTLHSKAPPLFVEKNDDIWAYSQKGEAAHVKKVLDENRFTLNQKDEDERTALHWAAAKGHANVVDFLCGLGAEVNTTDDGGWTPLISACSAGHVDCVKLLLSRADVNMATESRRTALHYACSKKQTEIVKLLLNNGAKVNIRDDQGSYPLHRAVSGGDEKIVLLLLKHNPDVNVQDNVGNTQSPLHIAAMEDDDRMARILVENGAQRDLKNKEKAIPMDLCTNKALKNFLRMYL